MATLAELNDIFTGGTPADVGLFDKIIAAVFVQAETIRNELVTTMNHANRVIWAKQAFVDPRKKAHEMFAALLAANAGATQLQVRGASDTAIQAAVANAVDIFATGT